MLQNYIKIAFRNLFKNKIYAFINILGLSIGLAAYILISNFIKFEFSYDDFHQNADRIYRPVEIQKPPGVDEQHVAVTMGPLAEALKEDFPEIENSCRIRRQGTIFCQAGERGFYEKGVAFADPGFLEMFDINLIAGDLATALEDPLSIIIDKTLAEKYFPGEEPLGKTIRLKLWFGDLDYQVTGVMEDYPGNSHLTFRTLAGLPPLIEKASWMRSWQSNFLATYILLKEGFSYKDLESKFPAFIERHIEERSWNKGLELYLQPLREIHLYSDHVKFQVYNEHQGSITTIYTFATIAVFLLLIACINFMNLSTARSTRRAREVGVRKVLGSPRSHLITQFLGESLIIVAISLGFALAIVQLLFPYIGELLGGEFVVSYLGDGFFWLEIAAIALLAGLIAGSYPAFFLSAFKPIQTLKSRVITNAEGRSSSLRKVLVVMQFAIAIILMINTAVVYEQIKYMRNMDIGYNVDQVVYVPLRSNSERSQFETLKSELLRHSGISAVSASAGLRGASGSQGTITVAGTNKEQTLMMRRSYVEFDFINTMEMQIVEGRNFSRDFATDTSQAVIINQAAVRELGWENPIGKQFEAGDDKFVTVVGVVKDYNFYKLTLGIEPLIMQIDPDRFYYMMVRVHPKGMENTLAYLEETWKSYLPGLPFEYDFLNEHFARLYNQEQNTGRLFAGFAMLAIFVACLGLFGLAAFTAEQRLKEIGIRKVLGASVSRIVFLLSGNFLKWVAVAGIIAFPVAYFLANGWLSNFVYRIDIQIYLFVGAALLAVFIALATVGYQAFKAALMNPVETLKYE